MDNFAKNVKNGLVFVGDTISEIAASVAEKNRLRNQLNHLKSLIKADSATRDQAFIELGRFYYENLREDASAENEALCEVIDSANDRISKASIKYVELLNLQNDTKIRSENAEKIAKVVSQKAAEAAKCAKEKGAEALSKAKETAADLKDKAIDKAADLKDKAAEKVEDIKERFDPEANADLEELIAAEQEKAVEAEKAAAEAVEGAAEEAVEKVEEKVDEAKAAADEESPEDIGF